MLNKIEERFRITVTTYATVDGTIQRSHGQRTFSGLEVDDEQRKITATFMRSTHGVNTENNNQRMMDNECKYVRIISNDVLS